LETGFCFVFRETVHTWFYEAAAVMHMEANVDNYETLLTNPLRRYSTMDCCMLWYMLLICVGSDTQDLCLWLWIKDLPHVTAQQLSLQEVKTPDLVPLLERHGWGIILFEN
jgi:hypothetical protein